MNRIIQFQKILQSFGIEFLAETECDRILSEYAYFNSTKVACPYKPRTYLTKERGNAGRKNVHLIGIGGICFGDTTLEAKLNMICSFLQNGYFSIDSSLQLIKPLKLQGF